MVREGEKAELANPFQTISNSPMIIGIVEL